MKNEKSKKAFITGITGQDGSYLAEFLREKNYEVHGMIRRSSVMNTGRIAHLINENAITLHEGDLTDSDSITQIIMSVQPDEIYNLAAQSHVATSFAVPVYSADVDALGILRILDSVHILGMDRTCKVYQASTSELFGKVEESPQSEKTPFHPYSPYAVAKLYGYWIIKEYREAYGLFAANGILFNHESERRGENFVTRKITRAVGRISYKLQDKLYLGNLDSKRDWGYAPDYVECMWLILQQKKPDDYVIATGQQHTVREFVTLSFQCAGIELEWIGKGVEEKGIDRERGQIVVEVKPEFYRPTDVVDLWGDPTKAKCELGWNPQATSFKKLIEIMVLHDMELARIEAGIEKSGQN